MAHSKSLIYKKAFSLLEVIFTLSIIAFLAMVAVPKLTNSLNKTHMVKIKSDIALIREGLNSYKNKHTLAGTSVYLDSLEENDELLFSKILKYPIKNSIENKAGRWNKISNTEYIVWMDNETSVKFNYNSSDLTFECDFKNGNCKKLLQSY